MPLRRPPAPLKSLKSAAGGNRLTGPTKQPEAFKASTGHFKRFFSIHGPRSSASESAIRVGHLSATPRLPSDLSLPSSDMRAPIRIFLRAMISLIASLASGVTRPSASTTTTTGAEGAATGEADFAIASIWSVNCCRCFGVAFAQAFLSSCNGVRGDRIPAASRAAPTERNLPAT